MTQPTAGDIEALVARATHIATTEAEMLYLFFYKLALWVNVPGMRFIDACRYPAPTERTLPWQDAMVEISYMGDE